MQNKQQAIIGVNVGIFVMLLAPISAKMIPWTSDVIILGRMLFAAPALLLYLLWSKKKVAIRDYKALGMMALLGTMLGWHWITYFMANKVASLAVAIIVVNSLPIWVTFLEPIFSHHKLQTKHILLSLVAVAGIGLMVEEYSLSNNITQGILLSLTSALLMALRMIWSAPYVKKYGGSAVMFWQILLGGLLLIPFIPSYPATITVQDSVLLLATAVLGTAFAHTIVTSSLHWLSARTVSLIGSIQPVYGVIIGILLFQETPSLHVLLGGIIIISIVIIETREQKKV